MKRGANFLTMEEIATLREMIAERAELKRRLQELQENPAAMSGRASAEFRPYEIPPTRRRVPGEPE